MIAPDTEHDAVVLGIDAAWTIKNPSGIALVGRRAGVWRCLGLAPSYSAFHALADDRPVDWSIRASGGEAVPESLMATAARLAGAHPHVVAIDMPIAREPITGRRRADDAISADWGGFHAATHSPSAIRPGPVSDRLRASFATAGMPLATTWPVEGPALIETYPHPIAMTLCGAPRRLPYKIQKKGKYWPELSRTERDLRLRSIWDELLQRIAEQIEDVNMPSIHTGKLNKNIEDAIDALLCCLTGMALMEGSAEPFGDGAAAIWLPSGCRHHRERLIA